MDTLTTDRVQAVVLDGDTDLDGFKRAARALLAGEVPPERALWHTADEPNGDLLVQAAEAFAEPPPAARAPVPASFVALCGDVALHRDNQRFALLYRLLWRLVHQPQLRHDPLDADLVLARHRAQDVRRDIHKMRAFVRFRVVDDGAADGSPLHVAWFEPEHHIVEANAPFFARRFAQMRWAILTPECSVRWDGTELQFGPAASPHDAPPADEGEQLWLDYYRSIFNPARLKLAMMRKEMPRRYWKNLPEAALIAPLAAGAAERSQRMVEQPASVPTRRRSAVSIVGEPAAAAPQARGASPQAPAARSLEALREATNRCRECPIGELATQSVAGEGPPNARLMLVGEQPGDQEDLRGRPFVGPAGQLLDRALQQLGWSRDAVYVTNAVKHFKFELRGKRRIHKTPAQREAAACLHWLEDEIALVRPQAIVALGATAARSLLNRSVAVMKERGQWLERADGRRVLVTLHPSALLRVMEPADREAAYEGWLKDLALATEFLG